MSEKEREDWLDEEFQKMEGGEIQGLLNWKAAKEKSGAKKNNSMRGPPYDWNIEQL